MGLDMVEFVMGVEEAFGIFILDADAEHIRTPGQLVDYVEARSARVRLRGVWNNARSIAFAARPRRC